MANNLKLSNLWGVWGNGRPPLFFWPFLPLSTGQVSHRAGLEAGRGGKTSKKEMGSSVNSHYFCTETE